MDHDAQMDWISEHVSAMFASPAWTGPICMFIDANCGTFEDVEENKLEYTPIHNAFARLVDDLWTASLADTCVTHEQFASFCEEGLRGDKALDENVVQTLLSVDNFLLFKAMMVKRNAELHRETLLGPGARGRDTEIGAPTLQADEEDADVMPPSEAERCEAQRRCVEAELQLAIALSYQLEQRLRLIEAIEERLRLIERLSEVMEASAALDRQHGEELLAEDVAIPKAVQLQPLRLRGREGAASLLAPVLPPPALSDADRWELEKKRSEAALQRAAGNERRAAEASRRSLEVAANTVQPVQDRGHQPPSNMPTEEERRQRAEHLKRQREALIEKKNREREQQLGVFEQTHGSTFATRHAERRMFSGADPASQDDLGRQLAAELSGQGPRPGEAEAAAAVAQKAAAAEMRRTITRQLKQTLIGSLPT